MGGILAGASDMDYKSIRINKEEKKKAQARVTELNNKLSGLEKTHTEKETKLKSELYAERTWAENAEKALEELRKEIEELKIKNAADEASVIAKFKESPAYDEAIANAGPPEVRRCWIVAERHIKTDPYASWETFIDEFVAAKKAIEYDKGIRSPLMARVPASFRLLLLLMIRTKFNSEVFFQGLCPGFCLVIHFL